MDDPQFGQNKVSERGDEVMFARVSTYQVPVEGTDEAIRYGTEKALPAARQIPGFKGVMLLVDRASGKSLSVTLWGDEAAMKASEEAANQIRSDSAAATGEQVVSVERFEVALKEL